MKIRQLSSGLAILCAVASGIAQPGRTFINFNDSEGAFVSKGASPTVQPGSSGGCTGARCGTGEGQGFKSDGDRPATSPADTLPSSSRPSTQMGRDGGVIAEWRNLMGYGADGSPGGGRGVGLGFDIEMEKATRLIPVSKDGNRLDRMMKGYMDQAMISADIPGKDLQVRAMNEIGGLLTSFLNSQDRIAPRIPYMPPPLSNEVTQQVFTAYNKIFWNLHHANRADDVKLAYWYADRTFEGMEKKRLPLYEAYASKVEEQVAKFAQEFQRQQDRPEVKAGAQAPEVVANTISEALRKNPKFGINKAVSPDVAASRSVKRRMGPVAPYLREDNPFYSADNAPAKPVWESKHGKFRDSLEQINDRLTKANPTHIQGVTARNLGLKAVKSADHANAIGNKEVAIAYKEIAIAMTDIALGFIPFIGVGRDLYEAATGTHLLTGRSLLDSERFIAALGVVTIGSVGMVKAGLELIKDEARLGRAGQVIIKALDNVVVRTAEEVNVEMRIKKYPFDTYMPETKVYEFTSPSRIDEGNFVRVFRSTGEIPMDGGFAMEKASIAGLSPQQIASKFSLKYVPDMVVDVVYEAGARLRKGVPARVMLGKGEKAFPRQIQYIDRQGKVIFKNPRRIE